MRGPISWPAAVEVSAVKACKAMMVNGAVVLTDPATGEIVAELAD